MKTQSLIAIILAALAIASAGCNRSRSLEETKDPTADLPARFKTQEPVPKPDFAQAAKDPKFQQAIRDAAKLFGAAAKPLSSEAEDEVLKGGVCFEVPEKKVEAILLKTHAEFLKRGFYLFRCEQSFGIDDEPDKVGLLPTTNKYDVIAAMDTNGDNYDIGTAGVIAWMKELELEQPFVLTGIGFDWMEGQFLGTVKNPDDLARRMYQFCPDIVDQGVDTVPALARELRKGKLYFWWD